MEFKIGEVVRLNSGGPAMTIYDIAHSSNYSALSCTWINDDGSLSKGQFNGVTVTKVEEPAKV